MSIRDLDLSSEFTMKATRSGGAGGQHVNKVSSRIELTFDITNSRLLSDEQKNILEHKLATKLSNEGVLRLTEDGARSQHDNREKVIEKLFILLENALKPVKKRKKSKPSRAAKEKRIQNKKKRSEVKKIRRERF